MNFEQAKKLGDDGMHEVIAWLQNKGIYEIVDVSNDNNYFNPDIDLVLKNTKTGQTVYIEIKTDYHITENVYIETISNNKYNSKGCFLKTQSDFIIYYFPLQKQLMVLPTELSQQIVIEIEDALQEVHVRDEEKTSTGLLVYIYALALQLKARGYNKKIIFNISGGDKK